MNTTIEEIYERLYASSTGSINTFFVLDMAAVSEDPLIIENQCVICLHERSFDFLLISVRIFQDHNGEIQYEIGFVSELVKKSCEHKEEGFYFPKKFNSISDAIDFRDLLQSEEDAFPGIEDRISVRSFINLFRILLPSVETLDDVLEVLLGHNKKLDREHSSLSSFSDKQVFVDPTDLSLKTRKDYNIWAPVHFFVVATNIEECTGNLSLIERLPHIFNVVFFLDKDSKKYKIRVIVSKQTNIDKGYSSLNSAYQSLVEKFQYPYIAYGKLPDKTRDVTQMIKLLIGEFQDPLDAIEVLSRHNGKLIKMNPPLS